LCCPAGLKSRKAADYLAKDSWRPWTFYEPFLPQQKSFLCQLLNENFVHLFTLSLTKSDEDIMEGIIIVINTKLLYLDPKGEKANPKIPNCITERTISANILVFKLFFNFQTRPFSTI